MGKWKQLQTLFSWAPKSLWMVTGTMKLKDAFSLGGKESYKNPRQCIIKERHHFANKCPYSQSYGLFTNYVQMWELDHKVVWAPKNWYFRTVVLEKALESPLDCKEMKPVNPKGNQPFIFIEGLLLKLKAPILWPPDAKTDSLEKTDAGKDWRQEWQQWRRWLDGITDSLEHEFEQILGDSERQGSLACCSSWGSKESNPM